MSQGASEDFPFCIIWASSVQMVRKGSFSEQNSVDDILSP